MKKHLNFSFGSNMSSARLLARLPNAQFITTATLKGYQLNFAMLSSDGSAKCSIAKTKRNEEVYGVVYALNDQELTLLDDIEGPCYDRTSVKVYNNLGESLAVECYIANTFVDKQLPFDWYVQHVLAGAKEHQLPKSYIHQIAQQATVKDSNTARSLKEWQIHQVNQ